LLIGSFFAAPTTTSGSGSEEGTPSKQTAMARAMKTRVLYKNYMI
jgi:hypothetical protein